MTQISSELLKENSDVDNSYDHDVGTHEPDEGSNRLSEKSNDKHNLYNREDERSRKWERE